MGSQGAALPVWRPTEALLQSSGIYLLTGALRNRGLGFLTAKWLAEKGAGHLVLSGRALPGGFEREAMLEELPAVGVTFVQADICSSDGLATLTECVGSIERQESGRLLGVFHGAAVFRDGLFKTVTAEQFEEVLRPKVLGTINMHLLTRERDLDFFVLHSSIVSVLGNFGQVPYAAANAFQDRFAPWRRSQGLPGQAINWPSLSGVGVMAGQQQLERRLAETRGFESIGKEAILKAFEACLLRNRPNSFFAVFDFAVLRGTALAKNQLISSRFATLARQSGQETAPSEPRSTASSPTTAAAIGLAAAAVTSSLPPLREARPAPEPAAMVAPALSVAPVPTDDGGAVRVLLCQMLDLAPSVETQSSELRGSCWRGDVPLSEMGLDSGNAIVAKQLLHEKLSIDANVEDLLADAPADTVVAQLVSLPPVSDVD